MPQLDPEKQRAFAVEVIDKLRAGGFEAYWAGGCVRDRLLGRTPKDYDVATSARPDEIRAVFGPRRTIAVGAAFGVMTVTGPRPAGHVEVATFRQDATYSDGRHPDAIEFSTPQADAQRRDFTINGLFFDPLENRVIDFVDGQQDLARRVVRAIGDPQARFAEDKLRLLRAVRFAATFDFSLDPATRQAVEAMAGEITVVSAERIAAEMRLMLVMRRRARAIERLGDVGLLDVILPELGDPGLAGPSPARASPATLAVLDALVIESFPLALAALVREHVDAAGCAAICRRWKLSNRETQRTAWLVAHQGSLAGARQAHWPTLQRILISKGIDELVALHEAVARSTGNDTSDVDYCRELLRLPRDELDPPPLLTGDDLVAHGVPRGKAYQRLLEAVRDAQLEKRIHTKPQALHLVDQLLADQRGDDTPPA